MGGSFERLGYEVVEWRARRGSEAAMWLWRISIICWVDHDLLEEDCIEEFLQGVGCVYVEIVTVFEEVKGLSEVALDFIAVGTKRLKFSINRS
ncbi:MAG: hypothetical protein Q4A37_02900 [Candidatus Saccharibacteria bacterium]|nr:hypothetical protein [Candidatus Saccharibacteria bacterium]